MSAGSGPQQVNRAKARVEDAIGCLLHASELLEDSVDRDQRRYRRQHLFSAAREYAAALNNLRRVLR